MTDFLAHSLTTVNANDAYRLLVSACHDEPGNPDAWYRMGVLLNDVKKHAGAAVAFARSDALRPGDERTLTNLGWSRHLAERSEEAKGPLVRAYDMGSALAATNLAQVTGLLTGTGKWAYAGDNPFHAVHFARRGVEMSGGTAISHIALALQLFFAREWAEGFREYEHRFAYRMPEVFSFPYPMWRGEKIDRLFVWAEQGLGDTIFGMRWLLDLAARDVPHIVFHTHKELLSLMRERPEFAHWEIADRDAPLPQADAWCAVLSLPVVLGVTDFEGKLAYISDDELLPVRLRYPLPSPRTIGICWAGGELGDEQGLKNITLPDMLRVCEAPGIEVHALQVGPRQADIGEAGAHGLLRDRSPQMSDMTATMRIVASLDLVVTVDTALAHLAGAMGRPTWLLLNQRGGDGRWGRTGETTNWYPSVRVFRKTLDEPWSAVVARVCEELRK